MNNFRRTIEEVVQVVKIADVTLRKRLAEFKDTASGGLTIEDFRSVWLDENADPPAFTQGIQKEEKDRLKKERKDREDTSMTDVSETESMAGAKAFKELADRAVEEGEEGGRDEPDEDEIMDDNRQNQDGDMLPPPRPSAKALGKRKRSNDEVSQARPFSQPPPHQLPSDQTQDGEQAENDEEAEDEDEIPENHVIDEAVTAEVEGPLAKFSQLTSEFDRRDEEQLEKARALRNISSGLDLNQSDRLDDLDEEELDALILTPEEVQMKRRVWMETNKDYLKELAGELHLLLFLLTLAFHCTDHLIPTDKQTGPDGELRPVNKRPVSFPPSLSLDSSRRADHCSEHAAQAQ